MFTLANSEDQDGVLQNAAFHQDLHYFLRQLLSSEKKKIQFYSEIITHDLSIYTMDHLKSRWKNPLVHKVIIRNDIEENVLFYSVVRVIPH